MATIGHRNVDHREYIEIRTHNIVPECRYDIHHAIASYCRDSKGPVADQCNSRVACPDRICLGD